MRYSPLVLGFLTLALGLRGADAGGWRPLWNEKDIAGWTMWLDVPHPSVTLAGSPRDARGQHLSPIGPDRDPLGVFTVVEVDGRPAVRISGQVFGELRTRESFADYHLKLQFKWGEKKWAPRDAAEVPRDSGLLYHVHGEAGEGGRPWARSVELQIQERDVGDLYAIHSQVSVRAKRRANTGWPVFDYDPRGEWRVFTQYGRSDGRCVKQPDAEKPTGEWNTVELVCLGDDMIHIVNGQVVMRLRGARRIDSPVASPVRSGQIILQSEGAEIFYRDLAVRPITAIPAEFAERE